MQIFLAFTVLVVVGGVSVEEYSSDAISDMEFIHPDTPEVDAKLCSSEVRFCLQKPYVSNGNSVFLEATFLPNSSQDQNGIDLKGGAENYKDLNSIGFRVMRAENTYLRLYLNFGTPGNDLFILSVTIFKAPRAVGKKNDDQMKDWANEERVGIISPLTSEQLQMILQEKPVKLEVKWLEKLLSFGVRQSRRKQLNATVYKARPIVLSEVTIIDIIKFVDAFVEQERQRKSD